MRMGKIIYIVYYSKGGNTKSLAKRIYDQFREFAPKSVELRLMDAETEFDLNALLSASAYIIGTPDFFSYPAGFIKRVYDEFWSNKEEVKGKPMFGFLTHGGGGKAEKPLLDLANSCKLKVIKTVVSQKEDEFSEKLDRVIQKNCEDMLKMLE
jgi:flavorubredoxin